MPDRFDRTAAAAVLLFGLTSSPSPAGAAESAQATVARFALWSAASSDSAEAVYRRHLEPRLALAGLTRATGGARPHPRGIHAWLLHAPSPVSFYAVRAALDADRA